MLLVGIESALLVLVSGESLEDPLELGTLRTEGTAGRGRILIPYLVMSAFVTWQLVHDRAIHSNKL